MGMAITGAVLVLVGVFCGAAIVLPRKPKDD